MRFAELGNASLVGPALWSSLHGAGLLSQVPEDLARYLALLAHHNKERNARIRAQCLAIGGAFEEAGFSAVLLKGATWLFDDFEPACDDRMMRDIDLLVAPGDLERAAHCLQDQGYRDTSASFPERDHFHCAPLLPPPGGETSVELHRDIAHRSTLLPPGEVLAAATPVAPGLLMPAPAHRLLHAIIHDQIENGGWYGGTVELRDTLDIARLLRRHGADIDWAELAEAVRKRGIRAPVSGALHVAHRTLGAAVPEPFVTSVSGRLHAWRCIQQRRWPMTERWFRRLGEARRALAWERDAYGLPGARRLSLSGQARVNRRRVIRMRAAWRRHFSGS